jgi:hypothetical protein
VLRALGEGVAFGCLKARFITFGLAKGHCMRRSDLGPLVRGKYVQRYRESSNIVVIEPDLVDAFPNSRAVNAALRGLVRARQAKRR